jgi:hypothetical protein
MRTQQELHAKLDSLFSKEPQIKQAIYSYINVCHAIDDIIDKKDTNPEFIVRTFLSIFFLCNNSAFKKHLDEVLPIITTSALAFLDSVKMEKSDEAWQKHTADVIRMQGNDLIRYFVLYYCGLDKAIELSKDLHEMSYFMHHTETGEPI